MDFFKIKTKFIVFIKKEALKWRKNAEVQVELF